MATKRKQRSQKPQAENPASEPSTELAPAVTETPGEQTTPTESAPAEASSAAGDAPVAKPRPPKPEPKAKSERSFRVRHGRLVVGPGQIRVTGDRVLASELTAKEIKFFLGDKTLAEE